MASGEADRVVVFWGAACGAVTNTTIVIPSINLLRREETCYTCLLSVKESHHRISFIPIGGKKQKRCRCLPINSVCSIPPPPL